MNLWLADDRAGSALLAAKLVSHVTSTAGLTQPRVNIAFSGGSTPAPMLAAIAQDDTMPWDKLLIWQVDERIAPNNHRDRNHTQLVHSLRKRLNSRNLQPMPVGHLDGQENEGLMIAAHNYSVALRREAGRPPVLDVVHLGLGDDGHTASLLPRDQALDMNRVDVAISRRHQGRRRMTLTRPVLQSARHQIWLAPGAGKAEMVRRLVDRDQDIPAGQVINEQADLVIDIAAASLLSEAVLATAQDIRALS